MAEKGYIKLHRSLLENPLWVEKPFSKGQAWADLLMLANYKDNLLMVKNKVVEVKRGQIHTSELFLAERWGWSRKKVRNTLSLLRGLKMVTTEGTAKGTTITIVNYAIYQDVGTAKGITKGTEKGPQRARTGYTTKEIKKERNSCCCLRAREDISKCFEEHFGSVPVEAEIDEIGLWAEDWYSNNDPVDAEEVLREAFKAAMKAGKKNVAYIAGFFKTLQKNKVKTADQFWAYQAEYDNAKK